MTVPTSVGVSRHDGNGATSAFAVGFHFQAAADLEVIVVNTTSDVDTTLTLNTHYTVAGAGDQSGGTVTLTGDYANIASTYKLYIGLAPALNNSTSLVDSGKVSNAQLQIAFDRMSQRHIYLKTILDRCIKIPKKEVPTEANTVLPDSTDRASRTFTWSAAGAPTAGTATSAGELSVTAIGETIVEAASADAVLTALGFSTFGKSQIDDANAAAGRSTLGLDGASGVLVAGDLAANSVITAKILDANVTAAKLANDAVAHFFQARLTLTSGTPVLSGDASGGTIYLTPYKGNKVALYNGTIWKLYSLTEISLALTATSGKNYDVWVYDNSGTLTLETTEWTNDTTRATALAFQDGVYCKTGALTRRYVGTFRASAANTTTDGATKRFVWNYYNRVPRLLEKVTASATWEYTTATWRQAEGSAANQVEVVNGVYGEEHIHMQVLCRSSNSSTGTDRRVGIGVNSTTVPSAVSIPTTENTTGVYSNVVDRWADVAAGYTYYAWLEYSEAAGTTTWYGDDAIAGYSTSKIRAEMKF